MVVAMALMTGYTAELKRKLGEVGAIQVTSQLPPGFGEEALGPGDARPEDLLELARVHSVQKVVFGQGAISTRGGKSLDVVLRGVEEGSKNFGVDLEANPELLTGGAGMAGSPGERVIPGVLLGQELARRLGASLGDRLELVAVGLDNGVPRFRYRTLEFTGTFATGFAEFDQGYAMLGADQLALLGGGLTVYEVAVDDFDRVVEVSDEAQRLLGDHWFVSDWLRQNPGLFTALRLQKLLLFLTLSLIVVVSTFNVASTLVVLVREKMRDIGILTALGMRPRQIEILFLACGGFLGMTGTAIGLLVGSTIAWLLTTFRVIRFNSSVAKIYFIDWVPFEVRVLDLAAIAFFATVVTLLASWIPARRAARIDPAQALRYE